MGDLSVEPSMEEILSSIKRIIAEEETPAGRRRANRQASTPDPEPERQDEVLELSDPIPSVPADRRVEQPEAEPEPARAPVSFAPAAVSPTPAEVDPIVSPAAADATRGALESLSRMMVKAEPSSDGTLEGLVRDMLRPMLREWLDANLPDMVETMVAKEIARISGQGR